MKKKSFLKMSPPQRQRLVSECSEKVKSMLPSGCGMFLVVVSKEGDCYNATDMSGPGLKYVLRSLSDGLGETLAGMN